MRPKIIWYDPWSHEAFPENSARPRPDYLIELVGYADYLALKDQYNTAIDVLHLAGLKLSKGGLDDECSPKDRASTRKDADAGSQGPGNARTAGGHGHP